MKSFINNAKNVIIAGNSYTIKSDIYYELSNEGYNILFASSLTEIINLYRYHSNILALLIDGDANEYSSLLLQDIKQKVKINKSTLILLSTFRISAMNQALKDGFDEFLAKPVGVSELQALLVKAEYNRHNFSKTIINHKTKIL